MINILVTGADGQLGSEIKKSAISFPSMYFEYTDVQTLDIADFKALDKFFASRSIQYVINCAAYTNVDKAETEKEKAYIINVLAVKNLAQILEKYNCRLIHISTDYVFDSGNQNYPYKEDDIPNTKSVYGSTKLMGEEELRNSENSLIIRTSWLYSSFGNNIIKTILRLGNERKVLNFVYDQVGTPTYAGDLAYNILKMIDYSVTNNVFKHGIYHFSNEGACSWYDLAVAVIKETRLQCIVNPIETKEYPLPAKRPYYSVLNKSKIKSEFNLRIPHWYESLLKCLQELKTI